MYGSNVIRRELKGWYFSVNLHITSFDVGAWKGRELPQQSHIKSNNNLQHMRTVGLVHM